MLNTLKDTIAETPEATLVNIVQGYAYFKRPIQEKKTLLGKKYHKGFEVRISCRKNEISFVKNTCLKVNIKTGNPYQKSKNRYVVPIYGAVNYYRIVKMCLDAKHA